MAYGYCKKCGQNVRLKKKDLDFCLLIILLFTGIGAVIYFLVWLFEQPDRCIYCGSKTRAPRSTHIHEGYRKGSYMSEAQNRIKDEEKLLNEKQKKSFEVHPAEYRNQDLYQKQKIAIEKKETVVKRKYCPYCGANVGSEHDKCPNCDSPLDDLA